MVILQRQWRWRTWCCLWTPCWKAPLHMMRRYNLIPLYTSCSALSSHCLCWNEMVQSSLRCFLQQVLNTAGSVPEYVSEIFPDPDTGSTPLKPVYLEVWFLWHGLFYQVLRSPTRYTLGSMVSHFQRLFDVTSLSGVYPRMNEVYTRLGEMTNTMRNLREILNLGNNGGK